MQTLKKTKIIVNENHFRLLFESDDELKNLYQLANSSDAENIEMAIQIGIGQGVDIEGYLKKEYQEVIDFVNLGDKKVQGGSISQQIIHLLNLKSLTLFNKGLSKIPSSINKLVNLNHLNMSSNSLGVLPNTISTLTNLISIDLATNDFRVFPQILLNMVDLRGLDMAGNHLKEIPENIENMLNLQQLFLHGNILKTLPKTITNLTNLKKMILKGNKFSKAEQEALRVMLPNTTILF